MKFTGRSWIDFISFCPEITEDKQLYVYRLHAKHFADEYKQIDHRLSEFERLIESEIKIINNSSYFIDSDQEAA